MELSKFKDEISTPCGKSRLVSVQEINRCSGSDMELGYDSNEEIHKIGYSVCSSPQDEYNSRRIQAQNWDQQLSLINCHSLEQHSYEEGESLNCSSSSGVSDARNQCSNGDQLKIDFCNDSVSNSLSLSEAESNLQLRGHASIKASLPIFHASELRPWYAVIAYDACVRLCLNSWAKGCEQAVTFLNNECNLLRESFSLRSTLLLSEEELLSKHTSELVSQGAALRLNKTIGKVTVQVRKVKMFSEPSSDCKFPHLPKIQLKCFQYRLSSVKARLSHSIRNRSVTKKGFEYVQIGKNTGSPLNSSSHDAVVQGTFSCMIRLKSSDEEDMVRMQPGIDEAQIFFPKSLGDDLDIIVQDSKGRYCGRVLAQITSVTENHEDKLSWWPVYDDPDEKPVGKIQLYISYSTSQGDNNHHKCCMVTEAMAYEVVLETAMKAQGFNPRNLELDGHWKWLVAEFATFYGVSDAYTKLRYLSYIMEIVTPTSKCLCLVHGLLSSIISRGNQKMKLSHKENRILGEVLDKLEQIFSVVFENYKSLDESSCSGLEDVFRPPTGTVAPALSYAVKLYTLTHDVFSSEAQLKLCRYFQGAARKRSRMHLRATDEIISVNERASVDNVTISTAYRKMKSLCLSMRDEIYTDLEIYNQDVLPSLLNLPNITSSIYNMELQTRLCSFLKSYPPNGPSPYVVDLVLTVADFQRELSSWKINHVKGGMDAHELFGTYISNWIKDTRLTLLGLCIQEKGCHTTKWTGVGGQTCTSPFIDGMYEQLKNTLNVYESIISRLPSYALPMEKAIADVQSAVVDALERHYADVLSQLKEDNSRFGFKHVHKLTRRAESIYIVPAEVGILMNSMRRMLDVLWPKVEVQVKSWSYVHDNGDATLGESLGVATITLRAKFRNYMQAIIEKIFNNTKAHSSTRWKKIVEDLKDTFTESETKIRMKPLTDLISSSLTNLHKVFETQVFSAVCCGLWDRFGKEVLYALEISKENKSWYRGSRVALTIVDGVFGSQMQLLMGNTVEEKDVKPPRSVLEAHSVLSKDFVMFKDSNYYC